MAAATSEIAPPEPSTSPEIAHQGSSTDRLFRISLDLYNQMGELGLLSPSDRVELLDGLLVKKMTKGPRHVFATIAAMDLLRDRLPAGYHPRTEAPIELRQGPQGDSAPEPDLSVVRGSRTDYRDRHPVAADVLLVVEVADSSLALDRKGLRRYAWFGIPTTWIINLRAGTVEVYTGPSGPSDDPGYANKATRTIGESLEVALDDRVIEGLAVTDLFG